VAGIEEPSRIETLSAAGSGAALFIFPGMGGELDLFDPLVRALQGERPLHALRLIGSQGECEPVRDLRRLAAMYAAEVRARQPHGPYFLLGFSFGAIAAIELARELQAQGEPVALVAMVDCPAPGYPKLPPALIRAHAHVENFLALSLQDRLGYLRDRLANRLKVFRKLVGTPELSVQVPMAPALRRVVSSLDEIYARYVPTPICVDVLFLTANDAPVWAATTFDDPLMGWGDVLRGRILQCQTPGSHIAIFDPGNVEVLAHHLRVAIAQVEDPRARELGFASSMAHA
jgi:thioesterase domain-containing protein